MPNWMRHVIFETLGILLSSALSGTVIGLFAGLFLPPDYWWAVIVLCLLAAGVSYLILQMLFAPKNNQ